MIKKILTLFLILMAQQTVYAAEEDEISVSTEDNIQTILNNTANIDKTLVFEPGEYKLNLVLKNKINLRGRSTKDTIFKSANSTQPIIVVNGAIGIDIQNITFLDNIQAIKLIGTGSFAEIEIKNNVFNMGSVSDGSDKREAIDLTTASQVNIFNNVFYKNNYALIGGGESSIVIEKNIFDQNQTDINNLGTGGFVGVNCFSDANSLFGSQNIIGNVGRADPRFVDPDNFDFHLPADEDNQDCIVSSSEEIVHGAYGGDGADNIPSSVAIETLNETEIANGQVTLSWKKNAAREVKGYKVYYSSSPLKSLNTLDLRKNLPSVDAGDALTVDINGLTAQTVKPAAPVLISINSGDGKLTLNWQAVDGADSYQIYHTGREDDPIEVMKGKTSYELTGLNNGTVYTVWLTAKAQQQYYFQVVAYTESNSTSVFSESFFISPDKQITPDAVEISDTSNKISAEPEEIVAYPELPNEGCFIATAAYGYYSADEVMVLRHFRDQYLLPSEYGRAFVAWYYTNGPYVADMIRQSEFTKATVRIALFPVIKMLALLESSLIMFLCFMGLYLVVLFTLIGKFSQLVMRKV